jgi:ribosomal RNA assembly protein|tara:strand:+ start:96 stop:479 length:384 start_codon:yes stop_codon:yes gene_type:complete
MPKFKKRNVKRKKVEIKPKKEYTPFPPEQLLRKEDHMMMSGEYFLTKDEVKQKAMEVKQEAREAKRQEKIEAKMKLFEAPTEDLPVATKPNKRQQKEASKEAVKHDAGKKPGLDEINELKKKFLKKK